MLDRGMTEERALMRRWVDTWVEAGEELEKIRRREVAAIDNREAIRQIFSTMDSFTRHPPSETSGLVEQQALFARLRK